MFDPELAGTPKQWKEARAKLSKLTPREREVLNLVARGMSTKQVALQLNISPRTVDQHRGHILAKLGTGSPVVAVRLAIYAALAEML